MEPPAVLLTDNQRRPLVVAGSYGLGRVTLIGVDISDRRLMGGYLPNGPLLWSAVFGWRSPAWARTVAEAFCSD